MFKLFPSSLSHLFIPQVAETDSPSHSPMQYHLIITASIVTFFLVAVVVSVVLLSLLWRRRHAAAATDDEERGLGVTNPRLPQQQSILMTTGNTEMEPGTGFVCLKSSLEFPRESLELGHIIGK